MNPRSGPGAPMCVTWEDKDFLSLCPSVSDLGEAAGGRERLGEFLEASPVPAGNDLNMHRNCNV